MPANETTNFHSKTHVIPVICEITLFLWPKFKCKLKQVGFKNGAANKNMIYGILLHV